MFDGIPISSCFVSESEFVSSTDCLELLGTIDEKHSVLDLVFFAEFSEKAFRKARVLRCSTLHVEEFVVIRVDCGVTASSAGRRSGSRFHRSHRDPGVCPRSVVGRLSVSCYES